MSFNNIFLRSFRILLLPVSLLYGAGVALRNWCYDRNWLKSGSFNLPVICIGNLSVGGTGKSPMVEYLVGLLKHRYQVATLSRGYKRRTKGYVLAGPDTTALEIGDEPMQFHRKHPDITVAVGEKRMEAIPQILFDRPGTEIVILDDAFQHRAIRAGFNILLTEHDNLYTRDFFLPTGDLRDQRASAGRAQAIIVTKCPENLSVEQAQEIREEIRPLPGQHLFFTAIRYGRPYHLHTGALSDLRPDLEALLVCGIANPAPLKAHLRDRLLSFDAMLFNDHHIFNIDDLRDIRKRSEAPGHAEKIIITTEKDAVRLLKFGSELADLPLFVLPITVSFLFSGERAFTDLIHNFMEGSQPSASKGRDLDQ